MKQSKNRRQFIKDAIKAMAVTSIVVPTLAKANNNEKTVKMLTPDGKLVEVNESALKKATKKKVSNKEIMNWMNSKS